MKKYLILFMAVVSMPFFTGCESDGEFTPPNFVTFDSPVKNLAVNEDASETLEIILYTANETGSDRTFTINVDPATTLDASAFSIPSTVTVPANSNEAVIPVEITGAGIDNAGDILVLSLGQEEDLLRGGAITINLTKLCEFDPAGVFTNTSGWFEAEFPVEVVAGASANQYVVKDFFAEGADITFTINEDLTITVPTQNSFVHPTYGQATVTGQAGSKIEPCLGKITLNLQHLVEAGSFGTYAEVFTVPGDAEEVPEEGEEETDGDESEGDA